MNSIVATQVLGQELLNLEQRRTTIADRGGAVPVVALVLGEAVNKSRLFGDRCLMSDLTPNVFSIPKPGIREHNLPGADISSSIQ